MQATDKERDLATVALAFLYAAGGTLGLVVLLLPQPAGVDTLRVAIVAAAALPVAGLALALRPLSWRLIHAGVVLGTALITAAIEFSGELAGAYSFYYLWAILFAAYFFSRSEALGHFLLVAMASGGVILASGEPTEWGFGWMLMIGSVAVVGVLVRALREQVDRLVVRLLRTADTDALTGLLNRRGFNEQLTAELRRSRRSENPVTLVVADLDRFKQINDRFGHPAGDEVLRRVSALLEEAKRTSDTIARIGGEEFALILPYTDRPGAVVMAERIRRDVQAAFADDGLELTISLGLATFREDADTQDLLMRAADSALYTAKELGRDRVAVPPESRVSTAVVEAAGGESRAAAIPLRP